MASPTGEQATQDLRTVVDHVVAIWIDLDGDQVGVNAGTTLEEIDASSSARNGLICNASIICMRINSFGHCLAEFHPKASATKTSQGFQVDRWEESFCLGSQPLVVVRS